MAPHFSSGKISIWFFSKWILGSYKTQTVNFKPILCKYLHSNMLKTLMFFNIWRKNLKIQKWSSEIMSRLQKFSENNFKSWGLWCWKNHVHISSGYENICIWSSRRLLKTTLYIFENIPLKMNKNERSYFKKGSVSTRPSKLNFFGSRDDNDMIFGVGRL